jgi:hypothetical protein
MPLPLPDKPSIAVLPFTNMSGASIIEREEEGTLGVKVLRANPCTPV